ncbi:polyprenyl synthetase family protein [Bifidobacterium sp. H1HS10N]|uniref:polyprenyl synthetase family protein n=1 Tax=Bifidobacterium kimbladii TaxID=1293826 RepID=UPI0028BD4B17|nr:polyprenyl synthetase family protein [Bifidobacterium sp. H1HS10N]MDT7513217.1 polyprenyl synthetase family protein [Bifidobacterium sp. H1HS10N]
MTAARVEQRMEELLQRRCDHLIAPESGPDRPLDQNPSQEALQEVILQAIEAGRGGKRLRALLLCDVWRALESEQNPDREQAVVDLACALEVYQTSALVHDDIIDGSPRRRGRPAAHLALSRAAAGNDSSGRAPAKPDARGAGLGILLGDLLASLSTDMALQAAAKLPQGAAIGRAFQAMQTAVVTGQVLDMGMEEACLDDPERLRRQALHTMAWKTASYTTLAPLALGLLASGADLEEHKESVRALGLDLGLAYQLADDLLDVTGDDRRTGKPVGGDIREGKRTVLLADTLAMADPDQAKEIRRLYSCTSQVRNKTQVNMVRDLMQSCGAVEASRRRMADLSVRAQARAQALADRLHLSTGGRTIFLKACRRFLPLATTAGYHERVSSIDAEAGQASEVQRAGQDEHE